MNNISNTLKTTVVVTLLAFLSTGCSTHIPVNKEVGQLNLKSEKFQIQEKTNSVIAVVSPVFAARDAESKAKKNSPMSPYEAMLMAQRSKITGSVNFQQDFSNNYAERLSRAFESSISEMISAKGFKLQGPYASFDDMTYREKKKIYLAFVPKVDFQIEKKVLNTKRERLFMHEDGVIQIGGSLVITMVEPMTGEIFVKKRINLSDFNIEESYVHDRQYREGGGLSVGSAMDKASAPDSINDTTDVALTTALNKFYAKAMKKINLYLDREEILSYEQDILKLKGLKRF